VSVDGWWIEGFGGFVFEFEDGLVGGFMGL